MTMSYSSKVSRRGIAPIDIDLSKAVFNIKRKVLFNILDHQVQVPNSSGAVSTNASAACTPPSPHSIAPIHTWPKKESSSALRTEGTRSLPVSPLKPSPAPVEIIFNPYTFKNRINSPEPTANVPEVSLESDLDTEKADPFLTLVNKAIEGLRHYPPELCDEGENGTYFLRDHDGNKIAVFKSADEEGASSPKRKIPPSSAHYSAPEEDDHFKQFDLEIADESPRDKDDGSNMEQIITDCVKNEVAPHVLDLQASGFYAVPRTGLVAIHPVAGSSKKKDKGQFEYFSATKVGSLQEFVDSDGTACDVGPVLFPVREVHKIGILDIRILNLDRHLGNILIRRNQKSPAPVTGRQSFGDGDSPFNKTFSGVSFTSGQGPTQFGTSLPSSWSRTKYLDAGEFTLTPIDHGYSLPHSFSDVKELWFEWITFPQAKRPFDEETRQFIESIDIEADARLLKQLGISDDAIKIMKITTTLLKKCASANWTLYDIAMLLVNCSLQDEDEPSALEDLETEVTEDFQAIINSGDQNLSQDGLLLSLIDQKISDLIQQHQQMLMKQQQH